MDQWLFNWTSGWGGERRGQGILTDGRIWYSSEMLGSHVLRINDSCIFVGISVYLRPSTECSVKYCINIVLLSSSLWGEIIEHGKWHAKQYVMDDLSRTRGCNPLTCWRNQYWSVSKCNRRKVLSKIAEVEKHKVCLFLKELVIFSGAYGWWQGSLPPVGQLMACFLASPEVRIILHFYRIIRKKQNLTPQV